MKIEIQKQALQKELDCLIGIAGRRATAIPVLSHIAIDALEDGTLRMSATDLNTSITIESQCTVKQAGSACVPAGKLLDITRLAADSIIKISLLGNGWVSVVTETSKFKLPASTRDSFPEFPVMPPSSLISVPSDTLALLINRASIAMATNDEGRFALQSLKFTVDGNADDSLVTAQMVGTDGHRLAIAKVSRTEDILDDFQLDNLVPRSALKELLRLTGEYNGLVTINADENHIFFSLGKRLLISTMVTGEFPNYELLLPNNIIDSVEFNTERLAIGINRVSSMTGERSYTVKCDFGENNLQLSAKASEEGEGTEDVASQGTIAITTGFNYQFLLDFLEVVGTERIIFDLSGAEVQAQLRPAGEPENSYRYVLMPMRIHAKEETAE